MEEEVLKQRVYILVPYNLSPIQQGIQSLHAVVEYANEYGDTPEYLRWSRVDKTVIVLNGGTANWRTNDDGTYFGTLNQHLQTLIDNGIPVAHFNEEDNNDSLTGVAFLCNEIVYDRVNYPDPVFAAKKDFGHVFSEEDAENLEYHIQDFVRLFIKEHGEKAYFLKSFASKFNLA